MFYFVYHERLWVHHFSGHFVFLTTKKCPKERFPRSVAVLTFCDQTESPFPSSLSPFFIHIWGMYCILKTPLDSLRKMVVVNQISQKQQNIGAINTSLIFVAHERENAKSSAGWLMAKRWELSLSIKKKPCLDSVDPAAERFLIMHLLGIMSKLSFVSMGGNCFDCLVT